MCESLSNMALPERKNAVTQNALTMCELSGMFSNSQKCASSGKEFDAAVAIRAQFMTLIDAVVNPYLGQEPGADSTNDLSDDDAIRLLQALQAFLPEALRTRLVRHMQ